MSMFLKDLNGVTIQKMHRASCHCQAVQLEMDLPEGLVDLCRCNCSLCQRKGAIMAAVPLSALRIIQGTNFLQCYQFNTKQAKHYFCRQCGIYTHHQRRSNPQQYAINVACLEGINALQIENVPVIDGINHVADRL